MKKHQCCRCKRHVSRVVEVSKKTGSRRAYCEKCLETLRSKGAHLTGGPDEAQRRAQREAAANQASVRDGSNRH